MIFKKILPKIAALFIMAAVSVSFLSAAALTPPEEKLGYLNENLRAFIVASANATADSKTSSTPLGTATADAVKQALSVDLAVVNGGIFQSSLSSGQKTYGDVMAVFSQDEALGSAVVTPAQLFEILEAGVSQIVLDETEFIERDTDYGGFPQVAGFTFVYDATAKAGNRVVSVELPDGIALDRGDTETLYTLAASQYMLDGGYEMPKLTYTPYSITTAQALADYIVSGFDAADYNGIDSPIRVIGTSQSRLFSNVSGDGILICAAFLIAAIVAGKKRYGHTKDIDHVQFN